LAEEKEMSNRLTPIIGHWYNHLDKGNLFQVVAIDRDSETIEIQEFDGGLDEFDFEEWRQMEIEEAAPPEDWTGPVDELEADDLGYSDIQPEESRSDSIENLVSAWEQSAEEDEEVEEMEIPPRPRPGPSGRVERRRHH
jgi:hypothetical protein